ncbi:type I-E CRISPR-associated protein Cse2/CasB [Kitasatospora sp. NPDC004289]
MSDTAADTAATPEPTPAHNPGASGGTTPSLGRARAFTTWIDKRSFEDPGVRSALRRGVGKDIDAVPFMHRYVASWLTDAQARDLDVQRAHYTVASLIAVQRRDQYAAAHTPSTFNVETGSENTPATAAPTRNPANRTRSLGHALADGVARGAAGNGLRESSAETRLGMLTRQSPEGLHRHLPGVVRQLRSSGVEVEWAQLLVDLARWRRHSGEVKRRWLQDYYRARQADGVARARAADDQADDQVAGQDPEGTTSA